MSGKVRQLDRTCCNRQAASNVAAGKLALQLLERPPQSGHLRLKFSDALRQIAELWLRARQRGGSGLGEGQAHFIATTPLDVGADGLVLVRNVKLDNVGKIRRSREDDARALIGNIANEAIDGAAALVEIDATAQQALLAYRATPFGHVRAPRPGRVRGD
jgi:hypothetical protein